MRVRELSRSSPVLESAATGLVPGSRCISIPHRRPPSKRSNPIHRRCPMRVFPLVLAVGFIAVASACHDKTPPANASADSAPKPADTVTTASTVGTVPRSKPATPAREHLVKVVEATPGLLAQAKIVPIDAQHLAQTVYPTALVQSGSIERRAGNLVYVFTVQRKDLAGADAVLVNAADGSIINTIRVDKVVAHKP